MTSQGADRLRRVLVEDVLRVDPQELRVVTRDVGGSFGMKAGVYTEYVLVLWAAKRIGRPVKWVAGRSESFVSDTHGRDIRSRAELALGADGRMLALRVESIANLGAYPGPRGPMIGVFAHPLVMTGQYDIGAASYRGKVVYYEHEQREPYRGSGQPGSYPALERPRRTRRRAGSVSRPRAQAPEPRAGESLPLHDRAWHDLTTAATIRQCSTRRCVLRTSTGSSNVAAKRNPVACCAVSALPPSSR